VLRRRLPALTRKLSLLQIAILIDDLIDTGRTISLAAQVLTDAGAKEVWALISHGVSPAARRLPLRRLWTCRLLTLHNLAYCLRSPVRGVDAGHRVAPA
jgi:orotate phosphoribosyltransferase